MAPQLSGNNCTMPVKGKPVLTQRYKHYDYNIQSFDSLEKMINTYRAPDIWGLAPNGWSGFLRKEAVKMFIAVTDDNSMMTGPQFDFMLRVLDQGQFGDAKKRNYIFHSIIGIKANNPVTKPWLPADGMQRMKCGVDAENWGEEYQALSILTGGLRFPICEWANFSGIFQEITKGVEEGTKLACEILVPDPPDPMKYVIDYDTMRVDYTPSAPIGAPDIPFHLVMAAGLCAPDAFYLTADKGRLVLCPDACAKVQADNAAKMQVLYGCNLIGGARAPQYDPR